MKQTLKQLAAIAMITFVVSFSTGMSASLMYQEHQALKAFTAAQQLELSAETDTIDFS